MAARQLLPLVKVLRLEPAEMISCYATLIYNTMPRVVPTLAPEKYALLRLSLDPILQELGLYYAHTHPRSTVEERVSDLTRIPMTAKGSAKFTSIVHS